MLQLFKTQRELDDNKYKYFNGALNKHNATTHLFVTIGDSQS